MKKLLLFALLIPLACVSAYGQDCSGSEKLQKHIYHPARLIPQKGCVTVRGIIKKKLKEGDGDFHVRLLLDSDQPSDLINDKNKSGQGRFLVFEPICVNPVTQASAKKACKNFKQKINLPNVGDHVKVTGIHLTDTDHGWLEIHPVIKIKKLP